MVELDVQLSKDMVPVYYVIAMKKVRYLLMQTEDCLFAYLKSTHLP